MLGLNLSLRANPKPLAVLKSPKTAFVAEWVKNDNSPRARLDLINAMQNMKRHVVKPSPSEKLSAPIAAQPLLSVAAGNDDRYERRRVRVVAVFVMVEQYLVDLQPASKKILNDGNRA